MIRGWMLAALVGSLIVGAAPADMSHAMLEAVNAQREERGLRPLALDARLTRAATVQARDLERTGRLDHRGSDGSTPGDRADRAGYRWSNIAENLAESRSTSPRAVVDQWMRSRDHRKNVLNAAYRDLGVAHEGRIWVIVMGRR